MSQDPCVLDHLDHKVVSPQEAPFPGGPQAPGMGQGEEGRGRGSGRGWVGGLLWLRLPPSPPQSQPPPAMLSGRLWPPCLPLNPISTPS